MNIALIFAGGGGSRMGEVEKPKQFLEIDNRAIIVHSIMCFEAHEAIDGIAVVCIEEWIPYLEELLQDEGIKKVKWITKGGPTGQQSIYNGVKIVYDNVESPEDTILLVSDGVRPNVRQQVITDNIECVKKNGTSATSTYVTETIIEINQEGKVINIPDRRGCMLSKAPQGFWLKDLMDVHQMAIKENKFDCTNSIELMSYYGHDIYIVEDQADNIKITTPLDIDLLKVLRK